MRRLACLLALVAAPAAAQSMQMDMPGMDMSGMRMPQTRTAPSPMPAPPSAAGTALLAGHAAPPPVPVGLYADRAYDPAAMAAAHRAFVTDNGGQTFSMLMVNIAELQLANGRPTYRWDAEGWWGSDLDRLVVKSEGRGAVHRTRLDDAEIDAFYSRAVTRYFDAQIGLRQDLAAPNRTALAFGIEGLSPYWFQTGATLFVGTTGLVRGRLEAWHDTQLTQRLILQPRAELNVATRADRRAGIASGLSDAELGLRLRYEWRRPVAPYLGVSWTHSHAHPAATQFVVGLRGFF